MGLKKGQELELVVDDIAFGGKGITRVDGLAVFVDQTVPQDQVLARVYKKKKNFAEARVIELIKPSPLRVDAPCPYSGYCGGCKWQFLAYDQQLIFKRRHVIDSLAHIGGLNDIAVHATIPSEKVFGYRNKMEFSCSDWRWLLPDELGQEDVDRSFALGLHVPGTFHKVLDIDACLLQPDTGNRILNTVRDYMKASGAPVYGLRSQEGFWRYLMLRHSVAYDRWMVNIITADDDPDTVKPLSEKLMAKYPEIASIVNNVTARKAGIAVGEFERHLAGANTIEDRIGDFEFEISANSFFQTNTRGAARLYDTVKKFAALGGDETVLDLYSGTGTIAIYLAQTAKTVTGMELVQSAIVDAQNNCQRNEISNCTFIAGDIKDMLASVVQTPDVMIIDPPRSGMHQKVVKQVLEIKPPKIVYVSCNPATMARDLSLMKEDYRLEEVQPVDMFPHTFHIEAVAKLKLI